MGNHAAGKAIGLAAEEAVRGRKENESALEILDRICRPWQGADAEFEAEDPNRPEYVHPEFDDYRDPHPGAALGMLLVEAFAPNGLEDLPRYSPMLDGGTDEEAACDAWLTEIHDPFAERYDFH